MLKKKQLDFDFLRKYINSHYLNYEILDSIKEKFLSAKPYESISLNNFLEKNKAEELIKALELEEYINFDTDLYKFKRTYDFKSTSNEKIKQFRDFLLDKRTISFFEYFTDSKINSNIFDMHSLKLSNTDYLLCHDDVVLGRQFAVIFNLSKNWKEEYGGQLDLFDSDDKGNVLPKIPVSITPNFNQMNIFKVQQISYHQIREVVTDKFERLTIGCWYHY
jgi:Rps23 Pro-64 3,4-dihydroxylase Tpa1-like proline 4-hydroxylase